MRTRFFRAKLASFVTFNSQPLGARAFLAVVAVLSVSAAATAGTVHPLTIYARDDRKEVFEERDPARVILAESVVALMARSAVTVHGDGTATIQSTGSYGENNRLCVTEKYVEQSDAADCSGFLVGENIIATAGHCVSEPDFCKNTAIVFGFMIDSTTRDPNRINASDVYRCKSVLHQEVKKNGSDFALVELDRPVLDRMPLVFAKHAPKLQSPLFVIGHPVGLPAKIADGASVFQNKSAFFVANLDTFGGNSGSAVFNENYEVAGILVRGGQDFVMQRGCYVAAKCPNEISSNPADKSCRGEDVTNPDLISKSLATFQGR